MQKNARGVGSSGIAYGADVFSVSGGSVACSLAYSAIMRSCAPMRFSGLFPSTCCLMRAVVTASCSCRYGGVDASCCSLYSRTYRNICDFLSFGSCSVCIESQRSELGCGHHTLTARDVKRFARMSKDPFRGLLTRILFGARRPALRARHLRPFHGLGPSFRSSAC